MEHKITVPYGLRVIRVLSILSILFLVITSVFLFIMPLRELSLLSSFFTVWTYLSYALHIVTPVLTIIAINKRSAKLYKPLLWLFVLEALNVLVPSFTTNIETVVNTLMVLISSFFIIWYWIKIKGYFLDQSFNPEDPEIKKVDKKVNLFIITWIILVVVGPIIVGVISGLGNVQNTINYMRGFEKKTFPEKLNFCRSQANPDECLTVAYSMEKDTSNLTVENCNLMSKVEAKTACYAMIDRCDVVTDERLKKICDYTAEKLKEDKQKNSTTTESVENK